MLQALFGRGKYKNNLEKTDVFLLELGEHKSNVVATKLGNFSEASRERERLRDRE